MKIFRTWAQSFKLLTLTVFLMTAGCSLDVSVEDLDPDNFTNSTLEAVGPFIADSTTAATIRIYVKNKGVPVVGFIPVYKVSGSGNMLGQCSETDETGLSICSLRSSIAESKTISLIKPLINVKAEVIFYPGIPSKAGFSITSGGGIRTGGTYYKSMSSIGIVTSSVILEDVAVPGVPRALVGLQGVLYESSP